MNFAAAATAKLHGRRAGVVLHADASDATADRDRRASRRFARQRGQRSACGKDLPTRFARSMLDGAFTKTGAPSGITPTTRRVKGLRAR